VGSGTVHDVVAEGLDRHRPDAHRDGPPRRHGLVTVPTLIVHGDRDALVPIEVSGRRAAAMIRDCTLVVYENASHSPFVTHRERLNEQLIAFARAEQPVSS
jgi:pimeloyl-ACP methyl ester carboxylesterase